MGICRPCCTGYQKETIIEENLRANYIVKESTRNEYLEKFREYKLEYVRRWHKADNHKDNKEYKKRVKDYIEYMKPYNKKLKNNNISKEQYLKVLNKYIRNTK